MRIGVLLLPTDPWPETVALVQRLERLGYHHVWTYDHLSWQRYADRPWHATYPWLAGVAAATTRIRIGTMVSNLNIRHPLALAKDAATIDHISTGRMTVGLGAAGTGYDATVMGQGQLTTGQRVDRLREAAALIDGLLRGQIRDHSGEYYQVNGAQGMPQCVQRPRLPLAIAAGGDRALRVVAAFGDAWITYGDTTKTDLSIEGTERIVASQRDRLDIHISSLGRTPSEIDRIYLIGNTEARPLSSADAFQDFASRYAELGFTDLVFHMPRTDDPVWNEPVEIVEQIAEVMLG